MNNNNEEKIMNIEKANKNSKLSIDDIFLGVLVIVALIIFTQGCGADFDDESKSILKKTEILSVVLDPPEANPGDSIKASYLIADEKGVVEKIKNIWLPSSITRDVGGGVSNPEVIDKMMEDLASKGMNPAEIMAAEFNYIIPSEDEFKFSEDGFSSETLSLMIDLSDNQDANLSGSADQLSEGKARLSTRTLVVSKRSEKNVNPSVKSISLRVGENGEWKTVPFITDQKSEKVAMRKAIAKQAFKVKELKEITIKLELEESDKKEENLRYEWVSTGGDFKSRKQKEQPYTVPEIRTLKEGEKDMTDADEVDPRLDPNLHPVFVVVRDNGEDNKLGQGWAEFYIRAIPDPDKDKD